jgi:hypothetical protein
LKSPVETVAGAGAGVVALRGGALAWLVFCA